MGSGNHSERQGPILLVEDESSMAEALRYNLESEGFQVVVATDGRQALEHLRVFRPRLVLLDLMIPDISGLDICRMIRRDSIVPIVVVTAKDTEADKVVSLEMGADDYITKPFSMRELLSRVRAHLRRSAMVELASLPPTLVAGPVEIDVASHGVKIRGIDVTLPPKEFALLEVFVLRAGRLLTRDLLISEVWGQDYFGDTRTLDVHVKRLRSKIEEDPHRPRFLKTVRGLGYKFDAAGDAAALEESVL
jgi:two-component system, OmpR family, response regulator RegX3